MSAPAYPRVEGFCPACGGDSLFLGEGGYVTCSRVDCTAPDAATTALTFRPRMIVGAVEPRDESVRFDQLLTIPNDPVTITAVCVDPEEYARIYNAGYDEAVAQGLADDPAAAAEWLASKLAGAAAKVREDLTSNDTIHAGALGDCSLAEPCTTCTASARRILAAVRVHLSGSTR